MVDVYCDLRGQRRFACCVIVRVGGPSRASPADMSIIEQPRRLTTPVRRQTRVQGVGRNRVNPLCVFLGSKNSLSQLIVERRRL